MITILPHEKIDVLSKYKDLIENTDVLQSCGVVDRVNGLAIESVGPDAKYGDLCRIRLDENKFLFAEVVGLQRNRVVLMPIGDIKGVKPGCEVYSAGNAMTVPVGPELLGRVISGTGEPMDGKGRLFCKEHYSVHADPVNPLERDIISEPLSLGVRAIDGLNTIGKGQRIGIFAGSGVGKSTLLGMIAKNTEADVNVIALIGERGREVKDFIEKTMGPEGMKKTVVVVATSDQPAMLRLRGAYVAHAIAEYFRDQGLSVNLLMDSVTRFAMAQREVGLAAGEPATMKGYPPSVFGLMAKLLERAGKTTNGGSITGLYTVLVDADDMNEPIADSVRSIIDGHIVLDRKLAHQGQYPAIDVLSSISRCMTDVVDNEHKKSNIEFRELLAAYRDNEDAIKFGFYQRGANELVDRSITLHPNLINYLKQQVDENSDYETAKKQMVELLHPNEEPNSPNIEQNPYLRM